LLCSHRKSREATIPTKPSARECASDRQGDLRARWTNGFDTRPRSGVSLTSESGLGHSGPLPVSYMRTHVHSVPTWTHAECILKFVNYTNSVGFTSTFVYKVRIGRSDLRCLFLFWHVIVSPTRRSNSLGMRGIHAQPSRLEQTWRRRVATPRTISPQIHDEKIQTRGTT
jgi:hypothetical protein